MAFSVDMFNKEQLLEEAEELSNQAPDLYKASVRLYFFARFLVSVFEARNHQIPIQVWNEYRNALDHFMRFLTSENYTTKLSTSSDLPPQIKEMQGHLQRAVLDISKLACHVNSEWIDHNLNRHESSVLSLVDNGKFLEMLNTLRKDAEGLFIKAKCEDKFLGENRNHNKKIVEKYLDAVFKFEEARALFGEKHSDIVRAYQAHASLLSQGKNISTRSALMLNFWVGAFFFIAGIFLTNVVKLGNNPAEVPKAEVPKAEVPKAEVPKAEVPKAEVPKAEVPKAEVPKAEVPRSKD